MAEQIIYDIRFEGLENAQKGLKELTQLQIDQQNAIKETQSTIKGYEKELSNIQKDLEKNGSLTAEQIAREQELNAAINEQKISLAGQKDELKVINSERSNAVKGIDQYNQYLNAELGSNEQLKAQLAILTKEYNALSQEERENTETGQLLTAQLKATTDKLKENEGAIGDNRRNVGNYEEAITNALGKVNLFGVNLGDVTKKIKDGVEVGKSLVASTLQQAEAATASAAATTAQGAATSGATAASGGLSKALQILKVALISTGIGAIVVALGALVGAFLSTQRGADALTGVITPIKFIFDRLLGVVQEFSISLVDGAKKITSFKDAGKVLADFFKSQIEVRIQSAIDLFGYLGSAIKKVFSGDFKGALKDAGNAGKEFIDIQTGVDDTFDKVSNSVKVLAEDIKEATKQGQIYANAQIALEQAQIKMTVAIAQTTKQLKEAQLIAQDQTATDEERMKALQEAISLTEKRAAQEKSLVQQELNLAILKTKQSDTDRAAYQEIANLKAKLIDLDSQALSEQKRLTGQLTGLQKAQIKAEEDRISKIQELIQTTEQAAIKERDSKLEELGLLKETTELTAEEQAAKERIYQDYYNNLADLQFKAIQEQLNQESKGNDAFNLENEKWYYEQLLLLGNNEEAKKALQEEYAQKRLGALQDEIKAQIQIIESELNQLTASSDANLADSILTEAQKDELQTRLQELQAELAKTNYEYSQIGIDPETGQKRSLGEAIGLNDDQIEKAKLGYQTAMDAIGQILSLANEGIKRRTDERIAAVDEALAKGLISEQNAENQKNQIRKEAFEKQKKMQVANATVNYLQGLISAWANAMQLPFPANLVIGALNTALLTATYGVNIKKINAEKFAKGGYIVGDSHSNGGVPFTVNGRQGFEAEGGEFIQNKKAVKHYGVGFMEAINNMKIPKLFEDGGFVAPTPISTTQDQIRNGINPLITQIADMRLEVINVESKFTKTQNQVKNVETAATY